MKKLLVITMMSLMAFAAFAAGDTGTLSGTVVDAEYGEAVSGAMVFVRVCTGEENGLHGNKLYSATTDEFGAFVIADVPVGEWEAIARLHGVGRDQQTVLIEGDTETIVTLELAPGECPGGGLQMHLQHHGGE